MKRKRASAGKVSTGLSQCINQRARQGERRQQRRRMRGVVIRMVTRAGLCLVNHPRCSIPFFSRSWAQQQIDPVEALFVLRLIRRRPGHRVPCRGPNRGQHQIAWRYGTLRKSRCTPWQTLPWQRHGRAWPRAGIASTGLPRTCGGAAAGPPTLVRFHRLLLCFVVNKQLITGPE